MSANTKKNKGGLRVSFVDELDYIRERVADELERGVRIKAKIAEDCGVSQATIDHWLKSTPGTAGMTQPTMREVASGFGMTPEELQAAARSRAIERRLELRPLDQRAEYKEILSAAKKLAPNVCAKCWRKIEKVPFDVPSPEAVASLASDYHRTQH